MNNYAYGVSLCPLSEIPSWQMLQWRNDPKVYKWCRQYEPLERWNHEQWLESLSERDDVRMYGILSLQKKQIGVCGFTSIDLINRSAEFSLYIAPDDQGEGHGTAALRALCAHGFMVLGLNHIFGETFESNPAAKIFEDVGFIFDGCRRKFYFRDGKYIDAHLYSILASEFRLKYSL